MTLYSDGSKLIIISGGIANNPVLSLPGFLPSTHYVSAKMPMTVVYPLPNADVSSYARHLKAYYDGTNAITYQIPIIVQGGAYPYVFQLMAGPPGMTIGSTYWQSGWTPAQALAANYGDVIWTPQAAISSSSPATVWVRVYSQDYQTDQSQYVDIQYTVSTSSSTSDFIFLSPAGSDTNSGTYNSPFATMNKVYGSSTGVPQSTFPGARLYLFGGTYATYNEGNLDAGSGIVPSGTYNPISIMGIPGQTVNFDITNSPGAVFSNWDDASDLFFQGFNYINTPSTSSVDFHYMNDGYLNNRLTYHNISAVNVYAGTDPTNNTSLIWFNDPSGVTSPSVRTNVAFKGLYETNRVANGPNCFAIHDLYKTNIGVTEFCTSLNCTSTGNGSCYGILPKSSNANHTIRYCTVTGTNIQFGIGTGCQNDGAPSNNLEICYCIAVNPNGVAIKLNFQDTANYAGQHWVYRCSAVGIIDVPNYLNQGPFNCENNAVQWGTTYTAAVEYGSPISASLPANITNIGTECQATSGVFDVNNNLTSTYSAELYKRGAQIG